MDLETMQMTMQKTIQKKTIQKSIQKDPETIQKAIQKALEERGMKNVVSLLQTYKWTYLSIFISILQRHVMITFPLTRNYLKVEPSQVLPASRN